MHTLIGIYCYPPRSREHEAVRVKVLAPQKERKGVCNVCGELPKQRGHDGGQTWITVPRTAHTWPRVGVVPPGVVQHSGSGE